jgi:hypothetical protein
MEGVVAKLLEHKSLLVLVTIFEFSASTLMFLLFLAFALVGACYSDGCPTWSSYLRFFWIAPALIPLIASVVAILRAVFRRATSRVDQGVVFGSGVLVLALAVYFSITDSGDFAIYGIFGAVALAMIAASVLLLAGRRDPTGFH